MKSIWIILTLAVGVLHVGCNRKEEIGDSRGGDSRGDTATPTITENSVYNLTSEWRDQSGKTVVMNQLAGKPRVVTMFYSSCEFACPKTIEDMKSILQGIPERDRHKVGMTLFSFDPKRDTSARLDIVARDMELEANQWSLLTSSTTSGSTTSGSTTSSSDTSGSAAALADEAIHELSLVLNIQYKDLESGEFSHSNTILILDKNGEIVHRQEGLGSNPDASVSALKSLLLQ